MRDLAEIGAAETIALASVRLGDGALFANRYQVLGPLGVGGMGAVYRVRDRELDEEVALKVVRPEIAALPGALERFRREVRLARRVTHPNVARTYDFGTHDRVPYLTMELLTGEPLSRRIERERKLQLVDALRIGAEIARGLAAAHAAGVVHRDLKPDNVFAAADRVVITDFGIARLSDAALAADSAGRTMGGAIGTPAYMSPEQVEGRDLDGRADIYALGVVMFELLTGELPFAGDTPWLVAAARLARDAPDPRTLEATIPGAIADLALAALARRRDERPDAQQFLDRIEALRGGAGDVRFRRALARPSPAPSLATPLGPPLVALVPLEGADGAARELARDLTSAIASALGAEKSLRLIAPGAVGAAAAERGDDPTALGRTLKADVVVQGSVRVAGGKVRTRAQMTEVSSSLQSWGETCDGSLEDPFALEDALIAGLRTALRARAGDARGARGPADPRAREKYDRALRWHQRLTPASLAEAITLLREGLVIAPNDPWIMSALGGALTRLWRISGGANPAHMAESEELCLRALAVDPSIGETFNTLGILRYNQDELRAAVRAWEDAVSRSPRLGEAHAWLGRLLCECGHTEAGLERLELAAQLQATNAAPHHERAKVLALLGDEAGGRAALDRADALSDSEARLFPHLRLALWWSDRALAQVAAECLDRNQSAMHPAVARVLGPVAHGVAAGDVAADAVSALVDFALGGTTRGSHRVMFAGLAAEVAMLVGRRDDALRALERLAATSSPDVLWFDHCPQLAPLRDDPRYAEARAAMAARAAQIWA